MHRAIAACLIGALACGPVVMLPQPAAAQGKSAEKIKELAIEGSAAFKEGNYEKAIEKFEEAYGLEEVPNLLYNIGKCYEKIGSRDKSDDKTENAIEAFEKSITYYRRFAVDGSVQDAAKQEALADIERVKLLLDKLRNDTEPVITELRFKVLENPKEAAFQVKIKGGNKPYKYSWDFDDGVESEEDNPTHRFERPGEYKVRVRVEDKDGDKTQKDVRVVVKEASNLGGILVTTVGVAALGVGGAFTVLAIDSESKFLREEDPATKREYSKTGTTRALIADVGLGVGLVVTTIGLILWLGGEDDGIEPFRRADVSDEEASNLPSITPVFGREVTGVGLHWTF